MRVSLRSSPSHLETLLIKMVVNDVLASFFILTLIFTGVIIASGLVHFQALVILVPTIAFFCVGVSIVRFIGYIKKVWTIFSSFKRSFREFDLQEGDMTIDFQPPFLIFRSLLHKYAEESGEKLPGWRVAASASTDKYSLDEVCEIVKGAFRLRLTVEDWHGVTHQKVIEGIMGQLHKTVKLMVTEIRQEVLTSKGVDVEKIKEKTRESISLPSVPPSPVKKVSAEPKTLAQSVKTLPQPVTSSNSEGLSKVSNEVEETLALIGKLKVAEEVPHKKDRIAHEQKIKKHVENAATEKEKKEMQEALYELQEINKLLED
ncbi:hypothetical protein K8R43_04975 [archaeon]|nr:hypothetical protein [archaeon]